MLGNIPGFIEDLWTTTLKTFSLKDYSTKL